MKTAKFIEFLDRFHCEGPEDYAVQALFELDPPITWEDFSKAKPRTRKFSYVWVSGIHLALKHLPIGEVEETYIFACDKRGNVFNWCELHGSLRDELDIVKALNKAGYEVVGFPG